MIGLLHAMAFMMLLLVGWFIWNNKPLTIDHWPFSLGGAPPGTAKSGQSCGSIHSWSAAATSHHTRTWYYSFHRRNISCSKYGNLKDNKAPGPDGIPAEIFKYGGNLLLRRLHSFINNAWASNILPTQWKAANIIMIYKKKGDRAICGISLLSVAGKLLAHVMLIRFLTYVVDTMVPESQCGFRRVRSTADMIFIARLLQEKCREQHRDLFIAFIDRQSWPAVASPGQIWMPSTFS